ncbi:MAG: hypothetical protein Q9222_004833 [Ikaeria aurantiellina]
MDFSSGDLFRIGTALAVLYLGWYLIAFKLVPFGRPNEPKPLPYFIPFIGHARWFFKDRDALFAYGKNYFKDDPWTVTIAGTNLYVVTLSQHIAEVDKNTKTLSYDLFVRQLHEGFNMSPPGVEKMWEIPMAHEKHLGPAGRKHLVDRSGDFHRLQLFPGPQLEDLIARFLARIEHGTTWENIPRPCVLSSTKDAMVISLYKWCGNVLGDAASRGFYGDALVDTSPRMVQDFLEFDKQSWMLLYQYPSFLASSMLAPRNLVTKAFDRYVALAPERKEDAAPYAKSLEALQIKAGVSSRDRAIGFQIFHFAMNANAYKLCFWLLAHIVCDHSLLSQIRKEIIPAVKGGQVDVSLLVDEKACPVLNAAFNETLRYTSAATSGRTVTSDTRIGNKIFYPGTKVLLPYRPGHFDDTVYGHNVHDFDPQRFLRTKDLIKDPSYRPFGGGAQYCSGRFLARREVVGFIAYVLYRYDIGRPEESIRQPFPRLDVNTPNLGIISPMPGEDLRVSIRHREL